MAFDAFFKIDGIEGESTDSKHEKWIEVLSYNTSVSQPASISSSSHGSKSAERANFSDFHISKALDKASPLLASACATGQHFPKATLEICRAGEDKQVFMRYVLEEVMISSYATSASSHGENLPGEEVAVAYGKIEWNYIPLDQKTGRPKGNVSRKYDITKNQKA